MDVPEQNLEPLPNHVELRDCLNSHEQELWTWFASARATADCMESLRQATDMPAKAEASG